MQKYVINWIEYMTHDKLNYLEMFHEKGYRMTRQRQAALDALCQSDGHATVGEIYYRAKILDGRIDRSTVYRSLDVFIHLGLAISGEDVNGERVYELIKEQHHHHLICSKCGDDIEVVNQVVEDFYRQLQDLYQYKIKMDHLIVFGICSNCSD
jgi:Fur family ferric uptake transcriptional regulator